MRLKKQGFSIVSLPIILAVCIISIIFVGVNIVNVIKPFIWYEKLNNIAIKYQFIIEKYGYLTEAEKNNLRNELSDKGFDLSKVKIQAPSVKKSYGQVVSFEIEYKYIIKMINFYNGKIKLNDKTINFKISKNSYSKV